MQDKRILVVGFGKLGKRIALRLSNEHKITAVKRSPIEQHSKLSLCFADVTQSESLHTALALNLKDGIDYLIYCLSPSERSEQGYRDAYLRGLKNIINHLPQPEKLKHILFISSTSVYHQAHGELVDESSPCKPKTFSGKILLEAEAYLANVSVPSTCIRFSGIYGGSRSRLIDQVKHALELGEALQAVPGLTNRIHEDDCVGFICHLVKLLDRGQAIAPCYVASDSCPVSQSDVYRYIGEQLSQVASCGQGTQLKLIVSEGSNSPRRAGSKCCANKRMLASGYVLSFESYREGYKQYI